MFWRKTWAHNLGKSCALKILTNHYFQQKFYPSFFILISKYTSKSAVLNCVRNETSCAYFSEKVGPGPKWVPMKTIDNAPTSFWAAFPIPIFTRASARFPTVASFGLLCLHLSITSHALSRFELQSKVRLRTTGDPSLNSAPRSLQAVPTSSHINNMCLCVTGSCKLPKVSAKKICILLKTISVA